MYLFLSIATTGLDAYNDDIIKISYMVQDGNVVACEDTLYCKPRRGRKPSSISKEALDFNGVSVDTLRTYDNPESVCYNLISVLKEYSNNGKNKLTVVGHNIKFDLDFLSKFIKMYTEYNLNYYVKFGGYDLLYISPLIENIIGEKFDDYKFINLCNRFSIHYDTTEIRTKRDCIKSLFDIFNKIVGYNSSLREESL